MGLLFDILRAKWVGLLWVVWDYDKAKAGNRQLLDGS